ncbi:MAG TPA: chromosomal replication initiation protein DnaA, partial [Mycobacterium sp.]|nr:chromosomal replication initiation protein DnaA [Mycobacterium sp.]
MTEDVGSSFATVWNAVVSELNGEISTDPAATDADPDVAPLTPQQRAWLNLVQPLQIVEGFALLSVPSSFVQNEIERHLRTQITEALSRRLGQPIELGVRIAALATDESDDGPAAPPEDWVAEADDVDEDLEVLDSAHQNWPNYFTERPHSSDPEASGGTSLNRRYTFDTFVIG